MRQLYGLNVGCKCLLFCRLYKNWRIWRKCYDAEDNCRSGTRIEFIVATYSFMLRSSPCDKLHEVFCAADAGYEYNFPNQTYINQTLQVVYVKNVATITAHDAHGVIMMAPQRGTNFADPSSRSWTIRFMNKPRHLSNNSATHGRCCCLVCDAPWTVPFVSHTVIPGDFGGGQESLCILARQRSHSTLFPCSSP